MLEPEPELDLVPPEYEDCWSGADMMEYSEELECRDEVVGDTDWEKKVELVHVLLLPGSDNFLNFAWKYLTWQVEMEVLELELMTLALVMMTWV